MESSVSKHFSEYPDSFLSHSRSSARQYLIRNECFASPTGVPGLEKMRVLATLAAEGISVFVGSHQSLDSDAQSVCRPVYSFSDEELPAIPTGRIFIQGANDVILAEIVAPLKYEVESVPPYAPNAAWIVTSDRTIASALSNLETLMTIPGIESVEPQMLRPAVFRGE